MEAVLPQPACMFARPALSGALIRPAPSLLGRLKRFILRGITGALLVGIFTAATPAHALFGVGDIVFDPSVFAQTLSTVENTIEIVQQAEQTYLLINSIYQGLKDWQNFGWVEMLDMVDLPFFDGVDGIDDLRDLASLTEMGVSDLQQLFAEAQTITRLVNDPQYRNSRTRAKQIELLNEAHQRSRRRKIVFARALKKHQKEMDKLKTQAKDLQDKIQAAASAEPANEATIASCQSKLQVILIRQQTLKDTLWAVMKKDEDKQQHDEELMRSMMREAGLQDTTIEVQNAMKLARDFVGIKG